MLYSNKTASICKNGNSCYIEFNTKVISTERSSCFDAGVIFWINNVKFNIQNENL